MLGNPLSPNSKEVQPEGGRHSADVDEDEGDRAQAGVAERHEHRRMDVCGSPGDQHGRRETAEGGHAADDADGRFVAVEHVDHEGDEQHREHGERQRRQRLHREVTDELRMLPDLAPASRTPARVARRRHRREPGLRCRHGRTSLPMQPSGT